MAEYTIHGGPDWSACGAVIDACRWLLNRRPMETIAKGDTVRVVVKWSVSGAVAKWNARGDCGK